MSSQRSARQGIRCGFVNGYAGANPAVISKRCWCYLVNFRMTIRCYRWLTNKSNYSSWKNDYCCDYVIEKRLKESLASESEDCAVMNTPLVQSWAEISLLLLSRKGVNLSRIQQRKWITWNVALDRMNSVHAIDSSALYAIILCPSFDIYRHSLIMKHAASREQRDVRSCYRLWGTPVQRCIFLMQFDEYDEPFDRGYWCWLKQKELLWRIRRITRHRHKIKFAIACYAVSDNSTYSTHLSIFPPSDWSISSSSWRIWRIIRHRHKRNPKSEYNHETNDSTYPTYRIRWRVMKAATHRFW